MITPDRRQASSGVKQTSFLPRPALSIARDLNAPGYLENGHYAPASDIAGVVA